MKMIYSEYLNINNQTEVKEIESFNGHLSLDLKTNEHFVLVEIESNSIETLYLTIILGFYSQPNFSSINLYSYQLYHLSENTNQQFLLYQNPLLFFILSWIPFVLDFDRFLYIKSFFHLNFYT
jgi:hypothetical protein